MKIQERTFPQFSRLPPELRQHIWRLALPPTSQVYTISCFDPRVTDPHHWLAWKIISCPRRTSTAVLQTCREARECSFGYHVARQLSAEVIDPLYANKILDFDSEGDYRGVPASAVNRPSTGIRTSSFCCSDLDLVIVNPWTWRIDRREGMSYHVTSSTPYRTYLPDFVPENATPVQRVGFQSVRYLALSIPAFLFWKMKKYGASKSLMFSGVDVLFVVKELRPHMRDIPDSTARHVKYIIQECLKRGLPRDLAAQFMGLEVRDLQLVDTVSDAMKEIARLNGVRATLDSPASPSELMDSYGLASRIYASN